MSVIEKIVKKAKELNKKIVLPETEDERVLKAADEIDREGIAKPVLIGVKDEIIAKAEENGYFLKECEFVNPKTFKKLDAYILELVKLREKKGMTKEKAKEILTTEPRYFGAMMVKMKDADGMVAGSNSPTADVLRSAIHIIGTASGIKTVSSSFLMTVPNSSYGEEGTIIYSDCGVVPNPTSDQLADIAISATWLTRKLTDFEPKVAMLSFSSKGSAKHQDVDKVIKACEILKEKKVDFEFDGELQADAALVPAIGKKKAPESNVAGKANVLIFPDLGAGNIAYKLTERLTGGEAFGPLLQGLNAPVNDLSRGCSAGDIVNVVAITALEAE